MKLQKYADLIVWQKAMDLVEGVYEVSSSFPKQELFGLVSQVRRAVVSVPSNIAEGQSRTSSKDFLRHLSIARGSLSEVETQLIIATRLHYVSEGASEGLLKRAAEVGRLLNGLSNAIDKSTRG